MRVGDKELARDWWKLWLVEQVPGDIQKAFWWEMYEHTIVTMFEHKGLGNIKEETYSPPSNDLNLDNLLNINPNPEEDDKEGLQLVDRNGNPINEREPEGSPREEAPEGYVDPMLQAQNGEPEGPTTDELLDELSKARSSGDKAKVEEIKRKLQGLSSLKTAWRDTDINNFRIGDIVGLTPEGKEYFMTYWGKTASRSFLEAAAESTAKIYKEKPIICEFYADRNHKFTIMIPFSKTSEYLYKVPYNGGNGERLTSLKLGWADVAPVKEGDIVVDYGGNKCEVITCTRDVQHALVYDDSRAMTEELISEEGDLPKESDEWLVVVKTLGRVLNGMSIPTAVYPYGAHGVMREMDRKEGSLKLSWKQDISRYTDEIFNRINGGGHINSDDKTETIVSDIVSNKSDVIYDYMVAHKILPQYSANTKQMVAEVTGDFFTLGQDPGEFQNYIYETFPDNNSEALEYLTILADFRSVIDELCDDMKKIIGEEVERRLNTTAALKLSWTIAETPKDWIGWMLRRFDGVYFIFQTVEQNINRGEVTWICKGYFVTNKAACIDNYKENRINEMRVPQDNVADGWSWKKIQYVGIKKETSLKLGWRKVNNKPEEPEDWIGWLVKHKEGIDYGVILDVDTEDAPEPWISCRWGKDEEDALDAYFNGEGIEDSSLDAVEDYNFIRKITEDDRIPPPSPRDRQRRTSLRLSWNLDDRSPKMSDKEILILLSQELEESHHNVDTWFDTTEHYVRVIPLNEVQTKKALEKAMLGSPSHPYSRFVIAERIMMGESLYDLVGVYDKDNLVEVTDPSFIGDLGEVTSTLQLQE